MRIAQPAPLVWVAVRGIEGVVVTDASDIAAVVGLPAWRARQSLAARAVLRELLGRVRPDAAAARLRRGRNGKPFLDGWPRVGVNMSHDGGLVAACVSFDREVGVDLQHPPAAADERMLRRCAPRYAARLSALPTRAAATALARIWTSQEACVKATGSGLAGRPWRIDVPPERLSGVWHGVRWSGLHTLCDVPLSCAWTEVGDVATQT